jgi:Icc-related predicted phosphoesterase
MKILFFADLHGDMKAFSSLKAKSSGTDIVVCAGDFTSMERSINEIMKAIDSIGKLVLMLHGNHEDEDRVKELCPKYRNLRFIHKAVHHMSDYVFMGYGGDGFSTTDPEFVKVSAFFKKEAQVKMMIILITHGPAYDTKIDVLGREPRGNKSYRKFIDEVQPHLAISGHFHENAGKHHRMGRTLLINPGKTGAIVNI